MDLATFFVRPSNRKLIVLVHYVQGLMPTFRSVTEDHLPVNEEPPVHIQTQSPLKSRILILAIVSVETSHIVNNNFILIL